MGTVSVIVAAALLAAPAAPGSPLVPFPAKDAEHGKELWVTDGTEEGTRLLADLAEDQQGSDPSVLTAFGDKYYFQADTRTGEGVLLFETDLTPEGTRRVDWEGPFSTPDSFVALDGELYFRSYETGSGTRLFRFGSAQEFVPIDEVSEEGWTVFSPTAFRGGILFARTREQGDREFCLWKRAGAPRCFASPTFAEGLLDDGFFSMKGKALFESSDHNLWRTDGTRAGTSLVKVFPGDHELLDFVLYKGALYFRLNDEAESLWRSDGTAAGTVRVAALASRKRAQALGTARQENLLGRPGPVVFRGVMYFIGYNPESDAMNELWRSDGTRSGTKLVTRVSPKSWIDSGGWSPKIEGLLVVGDTLLLVVGNGEEPDALWISDGTAAGTKLLMRLESE